jgi:hypothetical protein
MEPVQGLSLNRRSISRLEPEMLVSLPTVASVFCGTAATSLVDGFSTFATRKVFSLQLSNPLQRPLHNRH